MIRSQKIIENGNFSPNTLKKVSLKKTEQGRLLALCTLEAFREKFPDAESVFMRIFSEMAKKANDKCSCGAPISKFYVRLKGRYQFRCKSCRNIVSPLSYTPLRGVHVPINEILELAFLSLTSKHGITAAEVRRLYNHNYSISLSMCHRIKEWMGLAVGLYNLEGSIECDETYLRKPSLLPKNVSLTRGLGSERILPVIVMSERSGDHRVKAYIMDEVNTSNMKALFKEHVSSTSAVFTDEKTVYNFIPNHGICNHSKKDWSVPTPHGVAHVNTCESYNSFLKSMVGTVHRGISEQHAQKYIDHVSFVFSNRFKDVYEAIDSLFEALPPLNSVIQLN